MTQQAFDMAGYEMADTPAALDIKDPYHATVQPAALDGALGHTPKAKFDLKKFAGSFKTSQAWFGEYVCSTLKGN